MSKKRKHIQKSRQEIIELVKRETDNKAMLQGMLANQMITLWILWKSYQWDVEAIKEYWEIQLKWMSLYAFHKMSGDDIQGMIEAEAEGLGIDIASEKLLREEYCDDVVEAYD